MRKFKVLNGRWNLSDLEIRHFPKLLKELDGRRNCENWLKNLSINWCIFYKLWFRMEDQFFSVDALAYSGKTLFHFLVINEEGDYYIKGEKWYKFTHIQIDNPLHKLQKREYFLQKLLQSIGYNIPIDSYIVFINPNFNLYKAPVNKQLILPTQLNGYIRKLNQYTPDLTENHKMMIEELLSIQAKPPLSYLLPKYRFERIKKGFKCVKCSSFHLVQINVCTFGCKNCGHAEDVDSAILRNIVAFRLLFPEIKMTTSIIFDWSGGGVLKKVIRKVLLRNFKLVECGRSSYYIED
ncbi:nuclease-related domain-containing protein [Pseudoneobacillus sp. C159]